MTSRPPPEHVQRDYPLARLTTIRTGGDAAWFARPRRVAELDGPAAVGRGRGPRRRSRGLGIEPAGSGPRFRRTCLEIGRTPRRDRARSRPPRLRRRRPPAAGGGARGGARPFRDRVRRQHPRHRGRRRADERERLRRGAGPRARVGRGLHGRRASTAARPTSSGFEYRRSNLGPARGRRARVVRCSTPADPGTVKATLADLRARRREAQPSGIKTFGSTFKNPDDARRAAPRASCSRPRAARDCRSAARASAPSTRTSSRTSAPRRPPTSSAADRRGPPPRAGALPASCSSPRCSCSATSSSPGRRHDRACTGTAGARDASTTSRSRRGSRPGSPRS